MRLNRIELRNFGSYQSEDVDLTAFSAAVISGKTGSGKSTLLDAALWALFGSTAGVLQRQLLRLGASEMSVAVEFEADGHDYRVERSYRDTKAGAPGLVLLQRDPSTATGWGVAGQRKIAETEDEIRRITGLTEDLATATIISLQRRSGQFTAAEPGARRRILADLLRLDRFAGYATAARAKANAATGEIRALEAQAASLENRIIEGDGAKMHLDLAVSEHAEALGRKAAAETSWQEARAAVEAAREKDNVRRDDDAKVNAAAEALRRVHEAGRRAEAEKSAAEKALESHEASRGDVPDPERVAELQRRAAADEDIAIAIRERYAKLLDQRAGYADDARSAAEAVKAIRAQVERAYNEALAGAREDFSKASAWATAANSAYDVAAADYERARKASGLLSDVPCGAAEGFTACGFLSGALEARESLPALKAKAEAADEARGKAKAEAAAAADAVAKVQALGPEPDADAMAPLELAATLADECLREHEGELRATKERLDSAADRAARTAQDAREATAKARDAEAWSSRLVELRAALKAATLAVEARVSEREESEAALNNARTRLEAHGDTVGALREAVAREDAARQSRDRAGDDVAAWVAEKAKREAEVASGAAAREELAGVNAAVAKARAIIGDCGTLVQAYQDAPAMAIDAVAPAIEAEANRLLDELSTTGMRLTLATQKATADGKGTKEGLWIDVRDDVGERPYERYSGGERFLVDWALRVAMAAVLAEHAGVPLRSLVVDEGFGALDEEHVEAAARVLGTTAARFDLLLVITHVRGLADAFRTQILVEKGPEGSKVRVSQ